MNCFNNRNNGLNRSFNRGGMPDFNGPCHENNYKCSGHAATVQCISEEYYLRLNECQKYNPNIDWKIYP